MIKPEHLKRGDKVAIDGSREAFERSDQLRQMVGAMVGPGVDVDDGVEMVGHDHEGVGPELLMVLAHRHPQGNQPPPQGREIATSLRNRAQHGLVVRHLKRDEKPAVAIVDPAISQGMLVGHGGTKTSTDRTHPATPMPQWAQARWPGPSIEK